MSAAPIVVRELSVTYPNRTVLAGIDLVVAPGRRIGLIGENGVGKSTLLHAIAGRLPRRARVSGTAQAPAGTVLLAQEPPFDDAATIAEVLAAALAPLRRAVIEVDRLAGLLDSGDPQIEYAYAAALEFAVDHDAWQADHRALRAAAELGVERLQPDRRVGSLSGGERTRLAIATIVTTRPAALLLDEPTNHLDDAAAEMVARAVAELPGPVLFASHDRVLLDQIATDLVDLDPSEFGTDGRGGRRFGGGWTAYAAARAAARNRWEETYTAEQDALRRLRAASRIDTTAIAHNRGPRDNDKNIYGFKGAGVERTLARRTRATRRRLAEAEERQVPRPPRPLALRAALTGGPVTGRIVQLRDLVVPDRLRLDRLDLAGDEHLLVTGSNGSGKSTLLGVLSGRIRAHSGTIRVGPGRVAELTQDPWFTEPARSAGDTYQELVGDVVANRTPLRSLGLLPPRDEHRPVGLLSTGQRRRLALAVAIAAEPDLLLLDEPTNHLSLTLVDELESAIAAAAGAVVVASHDRWLRRRWAGSLLRLD